MTAAALPVPHAASGPTGHAEPRPLHPAVAGLTAVAGNVLGVAFLHDMPSAYRPASLGDWVTAVSAQPLATSASALSFSVGLIALALWARELGARLATPRAQTGALLIGVGALLNAGAAVFPLVQALHVGACGPSCDAAGRALLGSALALDALFNLTLGIGLLLMAPALRAEHWLRRLATAAGILVLPVSAQVVWDPAATLLLLAGPCWLLLVALTSFRPVSARAR
jgi:hypothetical protein